MKLDASVLRYLNKDDFRVLTAVETGMRNHDLVPTELIASIAGLRNGGITKILSTLLRYKLVYHENKIYSGYRLTYAGYDFLALRTLLKQNIISGIGRQIGVGKESDIYIVVNEEGEEMALKLQRLGRVSFRAIKKKRDYLLHRKSASWLYMSKLGAIKEYAFMKALYDEGFPTPKPIGYNRHAVVMSLAPGRTLVNVRNLPDPALIYHEMINLVLRFADVGLIHCDLNEFNLLLDVENIPMVVPTVSSPSSSSSSSSSSTQENNPPTVTSIDSIDINDQDYNKNSGYMTVIDFPQMVSTSHLNADELFNRDIGCIVTFFKRRYGYVSTDSPPTFATLPSKRKSLDRIIEASGFSHKLSIELDELYSLRKNEEENNNDTEENDETHTEEQTSTENLNTDTQPGTNTTIVSSSSSSSGLNTMETSNEEKPFFYTLSKDIIDDNEEADDDNEEEEDDEDHNDDDDQVDNDNDDANDDDDDDDEIPLTPEQKLFEQQRLSILESQRPPDGIRTRPGGRRIKAKGGEAYLRYKGSSTDDNNTMNTGTITNETTTDKDEIRTKVKQSMERNRTKTENQAITAKAFKGKNNMKDREKIKTREIKKYAGTDVGIYE